MCSPRRSQKTKKTDCQSKGGSTGMKILGIDYGRSKIGLAIAEGGLAEPWKVVKTGGLKKILENESFDKIVVGVSSGAMAEEQREFAKSLGAETFDETLTTKEAQ